ncbi:MAG TPA: hypothetical protein VGC75_04965 [Candidatus Nitrosocosmicus sp.]
MPLVDIKIASIDDVEEILCLPSAESFEKIFLCMSILAAFSIFYLSLLKKTKVAV